MLIVSYDWVFLLKFLMSTCFMVTTRCLFFGNYPKMGLCYSFSVMCNIFLPLLWLILEDQLSRRTFYWFYLFQGTIHNVVSLRKWFLFFPFSNFFQAPTFSIPETKFYTLNIMFTELLLQLVPSPAFVNLSSHVCYLQQLLLSELLVLCI